MNKEEIDSLRNIELFDTPVDRGSKFKPTTARWYADAKECGPDGVITGYGRSKKQAIASLVREIDILMISLGIS